MKFRIGITTGDVDGIGIEVTAKALLRVGPHKNYRYFIWTGTNPEIKQFKKISKKFKVHKVASLKEALEFNTNDPRVICQIASNSSPAFWVEQAARACVAGQISSMVTAPLSKQEIAAAGLSDIGHTDILKRISGQKHAFMGFIGRYFNVVLATGHIPISSISTALNLETLINAHNAARQLTGLLPKKQGLRPIGLLGLNPHSGDKGIIGSEEQTLFKKLLSQFKKIEGPLVPDVAFQKSYWTNYSCYLACYHDQGLIPFKAIHGHDSGVHLTLGLTLKRTSVDHGTAKDIFGKNKANPSSMIEAIKWAQVWAKT